MGLLKLKKITKSEFDPIAEAKAALVHYGFQATAVAAYVFGSAAGPHFSAESDIDVLVVFPDKESVIAAQAQLTLPPLSQWPFDWVFKEQLDFDRRSQIGGVCFEAKRTGVKIL